MMKKLLQDALIKMQLYLKTALKQDDTVDYYAQPFDAEDCNGREVGIKVNGEIAFVKRAIAPKGKEIGEAEIAELDEALTEQLVVEMVFFSVDSALRAVQAVTKPKSKIITTL